MRIEGGFMKILRIEAGKAEFSTNGQDSRIITDIGKDDIVLMLDRILNGKVEIDSETEDIRINNPAEKIIYNNLKEKFEGFIKHSDEIVSEITSIFEPIDSRLKTEEEKSKEEI